MAITITGRPREFYYFNNASPAVGIYSDWNAGWNPIVYTFAIPADQFDNSSPAILRSDVKSAIVLSIFEVGTNTLLAQNTYRPFKVGALNIDVAPFVRAYLFSKYAPDFSNGINCKDAGNSINFYITYSQAFDDGRTSLFNSEQTRPLTASCSAMQFGDLHGGNMSPYVPFNADLVESKKMKFLTRFSKPVQFKGYPFTLSFIYSNNLIGYQVVSREEQQDINGSQLIVRNINTDPTVIGSVNYLNIPQPDQLNAKKTIVSLSTGAAVNNHYVDSGYVDDGYQQIL